MIEFGHLSHPGTLKVCNESTYTGNGQLGFWMILDGIGGEGCGEVAANAARESLQKSLRMGQSIEDAIRTADQAVCAVPKSKSNLRGTSAIILQRDEATQSLNLGWVGATRAFGINAKGEWVELTVPDAATPTSIRTMALGVTDAARLHVAQVSFNAANYSRILISSDAVVPLVGTPRATEILKDRECSAQEMVDTLAFEALENDIEESFSVIVLKL